MISSLIAIGLGITFLLYIMVGSKEEKVDRSKLKNEDRN